VPSSSSISQWCHWCDNRLSCRQCSIFSKAENLGRYLWSTRYNLYQHYKNWEMTFQRQRGVAQVEMCLQCRYKDIYLHRRQRRLATAQRSRTQLCTTRNYYRRQSYISGHKTITSWRWVLCYITRQVALQSFTRWRCSVCLLLVSGRVNMFVNDINGKELKSYSNAFFLLKQINNLCMCITKILIIFFK